MNELQFPCRVRIKKGTLAARECGEQRTGTAIHYHEKTTAAGRYVVVEFDDGLRGVINEHGLEVIVEGE